MIENWENYLLNTKKIKSNQVFLGLPDGNFGEQIYDLSNKKNESEELYKNIKKNIENIYDIIKHSKTQKKIAYKNLQSKKMNNFKEICFWLVDSQFVKSIIHEIYSIKSLKCQLITLSNILNDVELIKISCINTMYTKLNSVFKLASFSLISLSDTKSSLPIINFDIINTLKNTPDELITTEGILYLRSGEFKQWKGYPSVVTIDRFLHLFINRSEINPIVSINLFNSNFELKIKEDEIYLEIITKENSYEMRIESFTEYQKWKLALMLI